ncbi:Nucleoside transporter family protein [Tritrichomonas foetus]|uniref:Nucleoside transporter family protein n=1 Tax=Tritrichomonas foetus TaxID=1144522 RepID=A0A1J4J6A5_9EUKA|nr:Nucleoside transporter family protein [Tritrichomonas foetus]|eukprot:OHS93195.1 Nucleoside transporter family protein [Tritrichomonas foetus]
MENLAAQPLISEDSNVSAMQSKSYSFLFLLLGNGSLLAFNLIINAIDIYASLTKKDDIGAILNRFYNIPCSLMSLLIIFLDPRNLKYCISIALLAITVILSFLPIFLLVEMSENAVYWGTMTLVMLTGIFSALLFSSGFNLAAQVNPEKSTAAFSSGNGCCGVLAAILRIITKAVLNKESQLKISGTFYFLLAALIMILTFVYFLYMLKKETDISSKANPPPQPKTSFFGPQSLATIKVIWVLWSSVFLNFLITLTIFPGYVSRTKSTPAGTWTSVIVTATFCVFDWVGRALPSKFIFPTARYAWIPIFARLLFFLIFIISLQNVINLGEPWWTFIWMCPFALTNGYSGTVAMIHGSGHPNLVTEDMKRTAGFLMPFAVNAGILVAMGMTYAMPDPKV